MTQLATTCPHCNREISRRSLPQHVRVCPDNPPIHDAIAGAIADPYRPGYAVCTRVYKNQRVLYGAPCVSTVLEHYGSWPESCIAYGLTPPDGDTPIRRGVDGRREKGECPHCHREIGASMFGRHVAICPERSDLRDIITAALQHPDIAGAGVNQYAYNVQSSGQSIPRRQTLIAHFGSWAQALHHYGLSTELDMQTIERTAMAEIAAAEREARRIVSEERNGGYGLAVAKVKPAPGLRVNGRECVRLELR